MVLQCIKLLELGLDEKRKVLEQSGLCLYCLKHAAELECFGQGGFSKPKCMRPGAMGSMQWVLTCYWERVTHV